MENFINHRISARASREFRRVTTGKTDITTLENGDEVRNARWKYKKLTFSANFAMLSQATQDELTGAFWAANAQLLLFRFRDVGDHMVDHSPLVVSPTTYNPVQLTKRYRFGPAYADRLIQAIAACKVYRADGVTEVPGTVDTELGIFTPAEEWQGGETWVGRFDVWVRFNSDDFDMTMHMRDISTAAVELSEQRARR